MGKFRDVERPRQALFKKTSPYFSDAARADGVYRRKPRDFCLPLECTEENLFSEIRSSVTAYFAREEIKWHDGRQRRPSNHMCSSQVCCLNFLFPFADKPESLVTLLRPVFPTIRQVLPMEDPRQFVSHEWIGLENYLGEKLPRHGKHTRGALFTSADAAVMFEHQNGLRQIVLIEWKYTESYSSRHLRIAGSGTDRLEIYDHLLNRDDCPLDKTVLPSLDALFCDPFDQLMRQQLLAHEMERAQELGAQVVSVLHVAPAHNVDYPRVTSPPLQSLGQTVSAVWKRLVRNTDRFTSKGTEELFGRFPIERFPELSGWWEYVTARYSWVTDN
jgi:hypothetical protein